MGEVKICVDVIPHRHKGVTVAVIVYRELDMIEVIRAAISRVVQKEFIPEHIRRYYVPVEHMHNYRVYAPISENTEITNERISG